LEDIFVQMQMTLSKLGKIWKEFKEGAT